MDEGRASRVLVVDDSASVRAAICATLEADGHHVIEAADGEAALRFVESVVPDLILLDLHLPGIQGPDVLTALKAMVTTAHVPVLVLTAASRPDVLAATLDAGAHDFVRKPFEPIELTARVRAALRTKQLVDRLHAHAASLEQIALLDELTRLPNRRHVENQLKRMIGQTRRHRRSLGLLMVDIDCFKAVNDRFGHHVGDEVLVEVATRMAQAVRDDDLVGRWGGEEFLALLPETDLNVAYEIGERVRTAVCAGPVHASVGRLEITASVGAAAAMGTELDDLVKGADAALYLAKRGGRNRVVPWPGGG